MQTFKSWQNLPSSGLVKNVGHSVATSFVISDTAILTSNNTKDLLKLKLKQFKGETLQEAWSHLDLDWEVASLGLGLDGLGEPANPLALGLIFLDHFLLLSSFFVPLPL